MNIIGIRFLDDGGINVEWSDDTEQSPEGGTAHSTYISQYGQQSYPHVETYAGELRQDAQELLAWFNKYKKGIVP
jgi:hypothetical protein